MMDPLNLSPFKRRIEELREEGRKHVESWREDGVGHCEGPEPTECQACHDIFGQANAFKNLVAEVERLQSREAALQALVQQWREYAEEQRRLAYANAAHHRDLAESLLIRAQAFDHGADQLDALLPVSMPGSDDPPGGLARQ